MPARDDLPSTLRRSPKEAQETWIKTHDSAVREYGEGARANRTAYASLKRGFEKVGNRWVPKETKGPSDTRAARGRGAGRGAGRTAGGVNAKASKHHLYEVAQQLDIRGRSGMSKEDLVKAIQRVNRRATARSR